MKSETISILSDPQLVEARDRHMHRLQDLFAGNDNAEQPFALYGVGTEDEAGPGDDARQKVAGVLAQLAERTEALTDISVFRPLAMEIGIHGVHFIDRMFGATVFDLDGSWQVHLLDKPVGSLEPPDLDSCESWQLAREIAFAFLETGVTVPLFGLPTIGSALNIGVNLYGEALLVAMINDPVAAHRDLGIINDVLCDLHRWYIRTVPSEQLQPVVASCRTQPPGFGQICGCTTQLLSPGMYREFVAPLDDELLSVYPNGGMIHLCGAHTQHVPAWRDMKSLRSIQLNDTAAEDLAIYYSGLREDQVFYVNTCEAMPVEQTMSLTGGRRVVLVDDMKDGMPTRSGPAKN